MLPCLVITEQELKSNIVHRTGTIHAAKSTLFGRASWGEVVEVDHVRWTGGPAGRPQGRGAAIPGLAPWALDGRPAKWRAWFGLRSARCVTGGTPRLERMRKTVLPANAPARRYRVQSPCGRSGWANVIRPYGGTWANCHT